MYDPKTKVSQFSDLRAPSETHSFDLTGFVGADRNIFIALVQVSESYIQVSVANQHRTITLNTAATDSAEFSELNFISFATLRGQNRLAQPRFAFSLDDVAFFDFALTTPQLASVAGTTIGDTF